MDNLGPSQILSMSTPGILTKISKAMIQANIHLTLLRKMKKSVYKMLIFDLKTHVFSLVSYFCNKFALFSQEDLRR